MSLPSLGIKGEMIDIMFTLLLPSFLVTIIYIIKQKENPLRHVTSLA